VTNPVARRHLRSRRAGARLESFTAAPHVNRWLPIFDWSTEQVWRAIRLTGLPYHPAYDLRGVARLSCVLCVLAPRAQLIAGARANPAWRSSTTPLNRPSGTPSGPT
jgi:3'-phosphoadenosine 5'-phosphosulfate sulfotransferase (PAPS reductase)/FAD synthetase